MFETWMFLFQTQEEPNQSSERSWSFSNVKENTLRAGEPGWLHSGAVCLSVSWAQRGDVYVLLLVGLRPCLGTQGG